MENVDPVITGLIGLNVGVMAVAFIASISEWQKKRKPWPRYRILKVPQDRHEAFKYYPQVRWGPFWRGIKSWSYDFYETRDWSWDKDGAFKMIRSVKKQEDERHQNERRRKKFRRENRTEVLHVD